MTGARWLPVLALLGAVGGARAEVDRFQVGLLGGLVPSESLYTPLLTGLWLGVGVADAWRLELSGALVSAVGGDSSLAEFLERERLLDPDDALNDRAVWGAELLIRTEPVRGRLSMLPGLEMEHRLHIGLGGGVRAFETPDGETRLTPLAVLAAGVDLVPIGWMRIRLDLKANGHLRRDDSLALGAEVLLGLGAGL